MTATFTDSAVTSPRQHWALAVLCLLREQAMHPYEMRRLMKLRHKDDRLVLKPGSLYNAVADLLRQGLIEEVETKREGGRPHRTVYRITATGQACAATWITQMLGEVRRDVSSFSVALDHLVHLTPAEAIPALERRRASLATAIDDMKSNCALLAPRIGRINLIEVEHDLALCRAQHEWLGRIIGEMRDGTLDWDLRKILAAARNSRAKPGATSSRKSPRRSSSA